MKTFASILCLLFCSTRLVSGFITAPYCRIVQRERGNNFLAMVTTDSDRQPLLGSSRRTAAVDEDGSDMVATTAAPATAATDSRSHHREFGEASLFGKVSMGLYYFILVFGLLSTVYGVVAPVEAGDCLSKIFYFGDGPSQQQVDEIVYFKALGRMAGLLGTVMLLSIAALGHNTTSCLLLLLWGCANYINFGPAVTHDFELLGGGTETTELCMSSTSQSIIPFVVLEAVAVVCSLLEGRIVKHEAGLS